MRKDINILDGKVFRTRSNSQKGEVSSETIFNYHEKDGVIWADYSGGTIIKGQIIGVRISETIFEIKYQHLSSDQTLKSGTCRSKFSQDENGKVVIQEKWKWTSGEGSEGESTIEEV